jgi:hypothetical protein
MDGLYNKYVISKSDGSPIDPNAVYFVLRVDKDPAARAAMRIYANRTDNGVLAQDIYRMLQCSFNKYIHAAYDAHRARTGHDDFDIGVNYITCSVCNKHAHLLESGLLLRCNRTSDEPNRSTQVARWSTCRL